MQCAAVSPPVAMTPAPVAVVPVMPAADAARAVMCPDHAAARAVIIIRVIAAVESRPEEMTAVKMPAMADKGRPADHAAAKAAAMEAMKTAAMKTTTVEATATAMKSAVTAAATMAAVAATAAMASAAATDLDQSVGDEFSGQRHGARTCRRQRVRALRRHQHQHRRRDHACRGREQTSSTHPRVVNENCNGTRIVGHHKSLPENARRLDVIQQRHPSRAPCRSRCKIIFARLNAP